ncbi:T9SS type A sorting domain-containing protein [Algivirga pacifica]|uniref:Cadherin domain-containing protein n=1 Tax=Algivirga pacifica TaxID=1162670 RepID=A0ABP9D2H2_9BACT
MRRLLLFLISLLPLTVTAQQNWEVNASKFEFSMTLTALVFNQGHFTDQNDKVAVFSGEECRGVASLSNLTYQGKGNMALLLVYANQKQEAGLTLKFYDASEDEVITVEQTVNFLDGNRIGSVDLPVIINEKGINHFPEEIQLSNHTLHEGNDLGAVIGELSTTDDQEEGFIYSLPIGIADNDFFEIDGSALKAAEIFDYQEQATYQVVVNVEDTQGGWLEQALSVEVLEGKILSVFEEEVEDKIVLYPNPTQAILQFSHSVQGFINVFDEKGSFIFQIMLPQDRKINIEGLPVGVYHLYWKEEGRRVCRKVVKE